MTGLDRRNAWIAFGGAVIVAAGVFVLLDDPAEAQSAVVVRAPIAPVAVPLPVAKAPVPPNASMPSASEAWSKEDGTKVVARRYRESKDLRAFYERALRTGGGAYAHFASLAHARCQIVASQGRVAAEQRVASVAWTEGPLTERLAAYREWIEPCAGFEGHPLDGAVFALMREAPGPLGAFYRPGMTAESARTAMKAALEGDDPDLAAALSGPVLGVTMHIPGNLGKEELELRQRRYFAERLAWTLATCELGADCAKGSQVWFVACMGTGDCAEGNYRTGYWVPYANMTAKDVPAILQRRDEMVAAVRARNWDVVLR